MREKIVAEVTRIGQKFNIRLLYGENRETIRFCSDEDREFACHFLRNAFIFDNQGGYVLYDCDREENVNKVNPNRAKYIAIEGGQGLGRYEAISFLNNIGYALEKFDIGGILIIDVPDLGMEVQFDQPWAQMLTKFFD